MKTADKILTILQNRNSAVIDITRDLNISTHDAKKALHEMCKHGKAGWYWRYAIEGCKGPRLRIYYVPARYTICRCKCGTTNQHYYPPDSASSADVQELFWEKWHKGPGHGPVTKTEMRRIKRRKKKERDSQ